MSFTSLLHGQQRYEVPGTKVSLELTPGKKQVYDNFPVIRGDNFQMYILELYGSEFSTLMKSMVSSMESKGLKVLDQLDFSVDSYKGRMVVSAHDEIQNNEIVYLFGDTSFYVMVSVVCSKDTYQQVLQSLKSIRYDKNKHIDWEKAMVIKPDLSSSFKLDRKDCSLSKLLFTRNGAHVADFFDASSIWVQQFINSGEFTSHESVISYFIPMLVSLKDIDIDELVYEGKATNANQECYHFIANCSKGENKFQFNAIGVVTDEYVVFVLGQGANKIDADEIASFMKNLSFK